MEKNDGNGENVNSKERLLYNAIFPMPQKAVPMSAVGLTFKELK
jgi:hypothetical protein